MAETSRDDPTSARRLRSLVTLSATRRLLKGSSGRMLFATVFLVYVLLSTTVGRMLEFTPTGQTDTTVYIIWSGQPVWNYPGLLVIAPNAVLALPFLASLTMLVVGIGVGLGMGASVMLVLRLVQSRRRGTMGSALSTVQGLSPALLAAVTLGACCSTTAASTAGIGLAAQASGTTFDNLLVNSWFLSVLQVMVLGLTLLAQEQLLELYGTLLGVRVGEEVEVPRAPATGARLIASGLGRLALALLGTTWSLSMFAAWTTVAPLSAPASTWFLWLVGYQALAVTALGAALFPRSLGHLLEGPRAALAGAVLRGVVLLGSVLDLVELVHPLWSWGSGSLVTRVQELGVGVFGVLLALAPARLLDPLAWSSAVPSSSSRAVGHGAAEGSRAGRPSPDSGGAPP